MDEFRYADYRLSHWQPAADLRWALGEFTLLELKPEARIDAPRRWRLLPDPRSYLLIQVYSRRRHWRLRWVGARSVFHDLDRRGRTATLMLRFQPAGVGWFLPFPASELTDSSCRPGDWQGWQQVEERLDPLVASRDWSGCARLLEETLRCQRRSHWKRGRLAIALAGKLQSSRGKLPVQWVQAGLCSSGRNLRGALSESAGLTPKRMARIIRLREAVRRFDRGLCTGWSELAVESGFYDQSHLIREFRQLAGESPTRLVGRTRRE